MDIKEIVKLIRKEMDRIIARSSIGISIHEQVFKIEELLEMIENNKEEI